MSKILMRIFPDAIGTYTRKGTGLSHNEVIIWNRAINEKLQKANNNTKKNNIKKRPATSPRNRNGPRTRPRTYGNGKGNGNGNGNEPESRFRKNRHGNEHSIQTILNFGN